MLLLRSLIAPVLLVLTVLATYLASLGLSWLLFTWLFGFEALDVGVPLLAFVFLVALGVDYNIFLVTRAREEATTRGAAAAMSRALTATGGDRFWWPRRMARLQTENPPVTTPAPHRAWARDRCPSLLRHAAA